MGYQQVIIQGNLSRDAEVRQVGQSQVAKTSVAVSERFRKADGTVGESAEFFDIEIWDKAGVYPYLKKGTSVLVVGQQKTDKWQDQNGQNREAKKIRVQVIQLCGSKPQQTQSSPAPGYAPQPQYQAPPQPSYQAPAPPVAPATPAQPPQYQPSTAPAYPPQPDLPF